jgi:riboflavin synthase
MTTLGLKAVGDAVNIETDILARHVARLAELTPAAPTIRSES